LILESNRSVGLIELVAFSIGKVLTPMLITLIMGGDPHFGTIIAADSTLAFGLGGSLLSEVYAVKSQFLYWVYPFLIIAYSCMINSILRRRNFFGILIFVFFLAGSHRMFRSGLIYVSLEPLYYYIYAASWYWLLKLQFQKRRIQLTSATHYI